MISCTAEEPNIVPLREPILLIIFLAQGVGEEDVHKLHLFVHEVISLVNPIMKWREVNLA